MDRDNREEHLEEKAAWRAIEMFVEAISNSQGRSSKLSLLQLPRGCRSNMHCAYLTIPYRTLTYLTSGLTGHCLAVSFPSVPRYQGKAASRNAFHDLRIFHLNRSELSRPKIR